jgi:hypothetical protein
MPIFRHGADKVTRPASFHRAFLGEQEAKDALNNAAVLFDGRQDFVEWYGMASMTCFDCHDPILEKEDLEVLVSTGGANIGGYYTFHQACLPKELIHDRAV